MYIPHLEWESFIWPIKITKVNCTDELVNLPVNSIFKVYRNKQFKLKGECFGTKTFNSNDINNTQTNKGYDVYGYEYDQNISKFILHDVHVIKESTTHSKKENQIFEHFSQEVYLSGVEEIYGEAEVYSHQEFFISHKIEHIFSRRTKRAKNIQLTKTRETTNNEEFAESTFERNSRGASIDHIIVKTPYFDFIVQKVPEKFSLDYADCIMIEYSLRYKSIPEEKIRVVISEIVGFVLGTHLLKIGETDIDKNNEIIRKYAQNPWGDSYVNQYQASAKPPIKLAGKIHNSNLEEVMTEIINNALPLYDKLDLSSILWKLSIARSNPIGTNLPILSSALESLASNYLKLNSIKRKYTREEKKNYEKLIKPHLNNLEQLLKDYDFKDNVIGKVQNPFHMGTGEILKLFFKSINVDFSKKSIENKALKARNTMAHASVVNSEMSIRDLIRITNAYQSLFNRSLLKVLGYSGNYIDYYSEGMPERSLDSNIPLA